jgi:hypothetical protein
MEFGVAGLAPELTEEFHALVDRLHNGSDQLVDMETMAEWSRVTKKAFAERTSFAHSPPTKSSAIINAHEQAPALQDPETQAFQVITGDVVADPERQALLHLCPSSRLQGDRTPYGDSQHRQWEVNRGQH